MYRVSPFTYLVSAMLSTGVSGADAICEPVEFLKFSLVERTPQKIKQRENNKVAMLPPVSASSIPAITICALMAVFIFLCWYYPIGLYRNAEPSDAVSERGALM
jgi:ABC-type multidrug transport system permease subunit